MKKWKCTVCQQVFEGQTPPVPCPVCGAGEDAFVEAAPSKEAFRADTGDKFLLVGGGVATVEAAKAIRRRNKTASVVIVSAEAHKPYQRPALNRVLEKPVPPEDLALVPEDFYEENGIELRVGARAQSVDISQKTLVLDDGGALPFTRLLLATGANPFNPIKQGYSTVPVRVLRGYDDTVALAKEAKGKRVVIVGGGILGLEAACALNNTGSKVTVVELAERILPLQTDEKSSELLRKQLVAKGIDLALGDSVLSTTSGGVVMSGGVEMDADIVLASLGVRSEVSLAVALGLDLSRGILVDEYMRTSHESIWAAGDCAEYGNRVQARASEAAAMGRAAGASMAGDESAPYVPGVPATFFNYAGFTLYSAGQLVERATEQALYSNRDKGVYKRLFFSEEQLCGAVFVGENPGYKTVEAVQSRLGANEALPLLQGKG